jgi:hypothetical protein
MMRIGTAAVALGVGFGFILAWSGMTDPDLIRRMLLLEDAYFFLVMCSSMAVAFTGLRLLRARRARGLLTGKTLSWIPARSPPSWDRGCSGASARSAGSASASFFTRACASGRVCRRASRSRRCLEPVNGFVHDKFTVAARSAAYA